MCENKVDGEYQNDAGCHQDLCGDGYPHVRDPTSPHDPHDAGHHPHHAESKHHAGHQKFVTFPPVQLEDCHVSDGAAEEEDEEDGGDGDIDVS